MKLIFHDLKLGFDKKSPLFGVDSHEDGLELESGLYLFLAPNGFGKTTFFQVLAGQSFPLGGKTLINERSLEPQKHCLYFPESFLFPYFIYPEEWIRFLSNKSELESECQKWIQKWNLKPLLSSFLGTLSQGEKRKVNLIAALNSDYSILLLDEPFNGIDFFSMEGMNEFLNALKKDDRLILLVTHHFETILSSIDTVLGVHPKRKRLAALAKKDNFEGQKQVIDHFYQDVNESL